MPASAPGEERPAWKATAERIDAVTPALMQEHHTPGVSIALIDSGKIVWQQCYGVKQAGTDDPVTESTVFEACSMSKSLFAYAFLKLVEAGRFELDRPLIEYLDAPYLDDQPLHKLITAQMALTHTTGFPNWRKGGWRAEGPLPVEFSPGSKFGYSGEGIWYLQQVVEHAQGEQLEPWIQRALLQPLEMKHSSYRWQPRFERLAAAGHTSQGSMKKDRPLYNRDNAAFSLYTTPTDYASFLIEVMRPDRTVGHSLKYTSVKQMVAPIVATDQKDVWRGLGWAVTKTATGNVIWHAGANGTGFRCYSRMDPIRQRGVVIMTNAIGGAHVWQGIVNAVDEQRRARPIEPKDVFFTLLSFVSEKRLEEAATHVYSNAVQPDKQNLKKRLLPLELIEELRPVCLFQLQENNLSLVAIDSNSVEYKPTDFMPILLIREKGSWKVFLDTEEALTDDQQAAFSRLMIRFRAKIDSRGKGRPSWIDEPLKPEKQNLERLWSTTQREQQRLLVLNLQSDGNYDWGFVSDGMSSGIVRGEWSSKHSRLTLRPTGKYASEAVKRYRIEKVTQRELHLTLLDTSQPDRDSEESGRLVLGRHESVEDAARNVPAIGRIVGASQADEHYPVRPEDPIFTAAKIADAEYVRMRLQEGLDPDSQNRTFSNLDRLLTFAVRHGAIDSVRVILKAGAKVDIRSHGTKKTSLFQAAFDGRTEIAKILLDQGADVNALDNSGNNCLREAIAAGNAAMVQLLLDAGCHADQKNEDGTTMRAMAEEYGTPRIKRMFEMKARSAR